MVKRADDKVVEGDDNKKLQHVVHKTTAIAERASKPAAHPNKQRVPSSYVSKQLGQLHRGICVVTSMRLYRIPKMKPR